MLMGTRDDLLFDELHPGILPEGSGENFTNLVLKLRLVISILSIFFHSFLSILNTP